MIFLISTASIGFLWARVDARRCSYQTCTYIARYVYRALRHSRLFVRPSGAWKNTPIVSHTKLLAPPSVPRGLPRFVRLCLLHSLFCFHMTPASSHHAAQRCVAPLPPFSGLFHHACCSLNALYRHVSPVLAVSIILRPVVTRWRYIIFSFFLVCNNNSLQNIFLPILDITFFWIFKATITVIFLLPF
jgi:hypothetical protein